MFWNLTKTTRGHEFNLSKFRTGFSKQPPDRRTIQKWRTNFKEKRCWCSRKRIATSASYEMIETSSSRSQGVNQKS